MNRIILNIYWSKSLKRQLIYPYFCVIYSCRHCKIIKREWLSVQNTLWPRNFSLTFVSLFSFVKLWFWISQIKPNRVSTVKVAEGLANGFTPPWLYNWFDLKTNLHLVTNLWVYMIGVVLLIIVYQWIFTFIFWWNFNVINVDWSVLYMTIENYNN